MDSDWPYRVALVAVLFGFVAHRGYHLRRQNAATVHDRPLLATILATATTCGGGSGNTPPADVGADATATDIVEISEDTGPPDNLFDEAWWPMGDESGILELLHTSPFFQTGKQKNTIILFAATRCQGNNV